MEKLSPEMAKALSLARICMMQKPDSCFTTHVAMRLKYFTDNTQSTAWVDGVNMAFNEEFFLMLGKEKQATLIAHEVGHVIRDHIFRRGNRDKEIYNEAGDYVINQSLKDAGWTPIEWKDKNTGMDASWLQDNRFKGMSTEEVYDILIKEAEQGGGGKGKKGQQGMPDLRDPSSDSSKSESEIRQHQDTMKEIIISSAQAAVMAGQPGSIPGEVQVWLDSLLQPKLPLAHYLRRFFKVLDKSKLSWERPNRRMRPQGYYLPGRKGSKLCHIAFAFDMSGSVSDEDIRRYVSELAGVMRDLKPTKLTVVQFDTRIISVDEVSSVTDIKNLKLHGRGGTCIQPLMKWAAEEKPHALLVFSDGCFGINPTMDPNVPVLWMIHGGYYTGKMPFGQTTLFEV